MWNSWWLSYKESTYNSGAAGDLGSIPELGRSPGGGHGNPLQYSCLKNSMDREAWRASVHRVAKSWTWLKQLSRNRNARFTCMWSPVYWILQISIRAVFLKLWSTDHLHQKHLSWNKSANSRWHPIPWIQTLEWRLKMCIFQKTP